MEAHSTRPLRRWPRYAALAAALALFVAAGSAAGCRTTHPNRSPLGERLPSVLAERLDGEPLRLPEDLAGGPAVLILGYEMKAQFDADRWLLGLLQAEVEARVVEVPTIPGWAPRLFSGRIDEGMRSGIPSEDWGTVATVYGDDAGELVARTGNENGRNVRVLLLDGEGRVRWFHDRGYSARELLDLLAALEAL